MQLYLFWPITVWDALDIVYTQSLRRVERLYKYRSTPVSFSAAFNYLGEQSMARKTGRTPKQQNNYYTEFVNWRPTAAESKAFQSWIDASKEDVEQAVDDLALSGAKLSIVFVPELDAFNIAVTPRDETDQNYGKTLSIKSSDWYRGVCAAAFYASVVAKGGVWESSLRDDII